MNIDRLKVEIDLKRAALIECRAELFHVQLELEAFLADYERVVGPIESALEALRAERAARARQQAESVWGAGFASFDEYLKRNDGPAGEMIQPEATAAPDPDAIRTLYRRLARRFHPDTSTDLAEQARLSQIMSAINAAYGKKDYDALRQFDESPSGQVSSPAAMAAITRPKAPETLEEWAEISRQLDAEIAMVKEETSDLRGSQIMALKIECALGKARGRDTLREIATAKQHELDTLRRMA